jgi:peptidyl-dipeptidase Dcp
MLLKEWTGPHGGLPPFDQVKLSGFKPSLESEMTATFTRIEAIPRRGLLLASIR